MHASSRQPRSELSGRQLLQRYIENKLLLPFQDLVHGVRPHVKPATNDINLSGLGAIHAQYADCTRCRLCEERNNIVFGSGSETADLMLVGEGPGANEDLQGLPFVGRSGQLLTKMLAAIDVDREETFITNIVKCRPPGNRNPEADEVKECRELLSAQIKHIQPKVILALGGPAAKTLLDLDPAIGISKIRGRVYLYEGIKVVPSFHPAYLLRTPEAKREAWNDMKTVKKLLVELQKS